MLEQILSLGRQVYRGYIHYFTYHHKFVEFRDYVSKRQEVQHGNTDALLLLSDTCPHDLQIVEGGHHLLDVLWIYERQNLEDALPCILRLPDHTKRRIIQPSLTNNFLHWSISLLLCAAALSQLLKYCNKDEEKEMLL